MEVQILHYNTKYGSPEEAADATDGFAALSAFYQMDVTISNNLDYLYDILPNVTQPGSSHIIRTPFPLALLLPDVTGEFYRCIKVRGRSQMTSAKFSGFWTPSPPSQNLQYRDHATSLPFVRIWQTPSPSLLTSFVNDPLGGIAKPRVKLIPLSGIADR